MILQALQLENFKQYRSLELQFKEGLVGIIGKNGAGKSSLFEAVLLCLFGDSGKEKSFYKSSWASSKDRVLLELRFEVLQKTYRIRREFRGKAMAHQAFLYDQQEELIASGATPVTEEVSKLLGMDKEAFTRSIFSGQKELSVLSSARREDRKRMVRKMIGLDNLDKIQQLVREDKNGMKKEIQGQSALLLEADQLKALEQEIKTLKKEGQHLQKQLDQLKESLAQKDKAYQQAKSQFDSENERYKNFVQLEQERIKYTQGLQSLEEALAELEKTFQHLTNLQKQIQVQAPQVERYHQQKAQLEQLHQEKNKDLLVRQLKQNIQQTQKRIAEQAPQVATLDQKIAKGKALKGDLEKTTTSRSQLEEKDRELTTQIAEIRDRQGAIRGKIEERQQSIQQIQTLGKSAQCPTCFQPLIHSYDDTLSRLAAEVDQYQKEELVQITQQL
ncbi:MAG: SMC family ATPase, partial [Bacteroidota bacterium]